MELVDEGLFGENRIHITVKNWKKKRMRRSMGPSLVSVPVSAAS